MGSPVHPLSFIDAAKIVFLHLQRPPTLTTFSHHIFSADTIIQRLSFDGAKIRKIFVYR